MSDGKIRISIYCFSGYNDEKDTYSKILRISEHADRLGLDSVWLPERHFQRFGGHHPNPTVLAAAIAAKTEKINIRAGSLVAPLHHPIRIVEDWSLVDCLSNGRVGIAFGSGWHTRDFVIQPDNYSIRKEVLDNCIDTVKSLWERKKVIFKNIHGHNTSIETYPRPIQEKIPMWLTTSGNLKTWEKAANNDMSIFCSLIGQEFSDIERNIVNYKSKYNLHVDGNGQGGLVSLMVHCHIGKSNEESWNEIKEPLSKYILSNLQQIRSMEIEGETNDYKNKSDEELIQISKYAAKKYFHRSSMIGDYEKCLSISEKFRDIGVDEIVCLVDFGVDLDSILATIEKLAKIHNHLNR
ncbi:MupA/Atu3671 family FMN-dependent luciferase-like monooxygenase [Vibrio cyclitrophicus]